MDCIFERKEEQNTQRERRERRILREGVEEQLIQLMMRLKLSTSLSTTHEATS